MANLKAIVNNNARILWYVVWSLVLAVFAVIWLYKAFDTARMLDYLLAFFWTYGSIAFAYNAKELYLHKNKKGSLKKQAR